MSIEQSLNDNRVEANVRITPDPESAEHRWASSPSFVATLVAELEAMRIQAGLTIEDLLEGLNEQRQRLYEERMQQQ